MPNPLLSILIPTVEGREERFEVVLKELEKQCISLNGEVQITFLKDNKQISIGSKRQKLYELAIGEYSVMIDDDDMVAPNYVEKVLTAIQSKPDCICYFEHINFMGQSKVSCHSNDFADWGENLTYHGQFYHYIRTPFFKDVIKTDICKQIPVKDMRYAEDITWSRDLKKSGLIKTEVFIDEFMYFYEYSGHLTQVEMRNRYGIK